MRYNAAFTGGSSSPSILVLPSDSVRDFDACALVIHKNGSILTLGTSLQVFGMFLAGWKTTSSAISRMVQLLGSAEGKVISEQLIEELNREIPESDQETLEQTPSAMPSSGILSRLPVTEATFLEAIR